MGAFAAAGARLPDDCLGVGVLLSGQWHALPGTAAGAEVLLLHWDLS
jgi:hypothetical protein